MSKEFNEMGAIVTAVGGDAHVNVLDNFKDYL